MISAVRRDLKSQGTENFFAIDRLMECLSHPPEKARQKSTCFSDQLKQVRCPVWNFEVIKFHLLSFTCFI